MKRLYIIILLLAVSTTQLDAQFFKFNIGIHGGASYNMLQGINSDAQLAGSLSPSILHNIGGQGGLNLELRFGNVLGLAAEGNYAFCSYGFLHHDVESILNQHYLQIPVFFQVWMTRTAIFEIGFQQSVLLASEYNEKTGSRTAPVYTVNPDSGALKYHFGLIGGFKFNLNRSIYLNIRAAYGLSDAYVINGSSFPNLSAQIGLGFRLYGHRERAF